MKTVLWIIVTKNTDLPALFLPKFPGLQEKNRKFTGDLQEISPDNTGVYRRLLINTGDLQGIFTEVAILMSEKQLCKEDLNAPIQLMPEIHFILKQLKLIFS